MNRNEFVEALTDALRDEGLLPASGQAPLAGQAYIVWCSHIFVRVPGVSRPKLIARVKPLCVQCLGHTNGSLRKKLFAIEKTTRFMPLAGLRMEERPEAKASLKPLSLHVVAAVVHLCREAARG